MNVPASVPTPKRTRKRRPAPKLATVHRLEPRIGRHYCALVIRNGVIHGADEYVPGATVLLVNEDQARAKPAPVIDLAAYRARRASASS